MLNNRIDIMSLMRNWHTEGIDQENLPFSVFQLVSDQKVVLFTIL